MSDGRKAVQRFSKSRGSEKCAPWRRILFCGKKGAHYGQGTLGTDLTRNGLLMLPGEKTLRGKSYWNCTKFLSSPSRS